MSIKADHHPDACEIVSTRVFEFTPQQLFDAFRDPERLARWWGPKGFTNSFHEFDFRPGGTWRFVMHGPTGANFENRNDFVVIEDARRVVFDHVLAPVFRMTISLEDHGSRTRMTWRMTFTTAEECAKLKALVVPSNEENFDRLDAELRR